MADASSTVSGPSSKSDLVANSPNRCDPLYLHASDHPSLKLVSNQLTLNNYLLWNRSMRVALKSKNKLSFIDGAYPQPEDVLSEAYQSWSFVDSMVISWIINVMTKDLAEAYLYSSSLRALWLELEEKYDVSDKSQIFNLREQMISLA